MICVVLRPLPGPGGIAYQAGEEVDTTEWLHTDRLINQRYLRVKSLNKRKVDDDKQSAKRESVKDLKPVTAKKRIV